MPMLFRLPAATQLAAVICVAALAAIMMPVTPSQAAHRYGAAHIIMNEILREKHRPERVYVREKHRPKRVYVVPQPAIPRLRIAEVQRILNMIGYNAGRVDGAMGRRTRTALVLFQRDNGLRQTGTANQSTVNALREAEAVYLAGTRPAPVQPRPAKQQRLQPQQAATQPGEISGLYCTDNDSLALQEMENGDMRFMISSWQGRGQTCAGEGTARRTPYSWRYEADMRGGDSERCGLAISAGGAVRLSTDSDARCQSLCGARATLNGLAFPQTSRVGTVPAGTFDDQEAFVNRVCRS